MDLNDIKSVRPNQAKTTAPKAESAMGTPVTNEPAEGLSEFTHPKSWLSRHRKLVIFIACLIVVLSGGGIIAAASRHHTPTTQHLAVIVSASTPVPTPVTTPAPLTGLPVTPQLAARTIVGVMIENLYPDARPQSGLQSAGIVYEALAEGGITRFLALYGDTSAPSIGPVRSLRPYYIDWAMEYGAPIAHAGGSSDALNIVKTLGIKDLNALIIGAPSFYRTSDRYAPHNLYTTSALLDTLLSTRGYVQTPSFTPSPRKADNPTTSPTNPKIHISFSSSPYDVDYVYQANGDDYLRSDGGSPQIDRNTGQQITVKNVVIEYMPVTYTPAPHDSLYINMPTVGSGAAVVFRDGTAIKGTWSKSARITRTQLLDASGQPIALNAGNTWYEVVPNGRLVTY